MPRRRERSRKKQLTPYMRYYLLGDPPPVDLPSGWKVESFMFRTCREPERSERLLALWIQHRDGLMADWKREGRKGRPWGAKRFDKKN